MGTNASRPKFDSHSTTEGELCKLPEGGRCIAQRWLQDFAIVPARQDHSPVAAGKVQPLGRESRLQKTPADQIEKGCQGVLSPNLRRQERNIIGFAAGMDWRGLAAIFGGGPKWRRVSLGGSFKPERISEMRGKG
jgi:hypothetical protein